MKAVQVVGYHTKLQLTAQGKVKLHTSKYPLEEFQREIGRASCRERVCR